MQAPGEFPFREARWILSAEYSGTDRNATFHFERELLLEGLAGAQFRVAITADSRYRLLINNQWVLDGPARGYPEHWFYDDTDVTSLLREGTNHLSVFVTHLGIDTFQYLRGRPGLLVAFYREGSLSPLLVSDDTWETRHATEWVERVPRVSSQQGFEEHYDAARMSASWSPAKVIGTSDENERRGLRRRTTSLLNRIPRSFPSLLATERIKGVDRIWSFPLRLLFSPFPNGINLHGMAGVLSSTIRASEETNLALSFLGPALEIFLDGHPLDMQTTQDLRVAHSTLSPGLHWLNLAICTPYDHSTELALAYDSDQPLEWQSPLASPDAEWMTTGPLWTSDHDTNCFLSHRGPSPTTASFRPPFGGAFAVDVARIEQRVRDIACTNGLSAFEAAAMPYLPRPLRPEELSEADAYGRLRTDRVVEIISNQLAPGANNPAKPSCLKIPLRCAAQTRLLLDLEDLTIGYFEMDFEAPAGTVIEAFFFEHLERRNGAPTIQHLYQDNAISYRNSFRYVAREGQNYFRSRQRRGLRYAQIVFRDGPVVVHRFGVTESTYQPSHRARFTCSDERLNKIHEISQRTLLLCMEDTFTDCPTYEQAYWVGDGKNESLFACRTFGAHDLSEHCARLVAQSLERLPLAASQCPSGWDVIIPSFSFLWILSVWETYWHTGNKSFLEDVYPAITANLRTAALYCTDHGLFSAPAWNFFDWTGIDQEHPTVLHNSLLLAAACQAATGAAEALGRTDDAIIFKRQRAALLPAIHALWDAGRRAYLDAILPDGTLSNTSSQHTSFLALLYNLLPVDLHPAALANCVHPPPDMVRVGSPNAMFFLIEALRQAGQEQAALDHLRAYWGRMLEAKAKTFWETVNPEGSEFPTRSHCHGWSSSPVYFLPALLFGVETPRAGWRELIVRPKAFNLEFASAEICTPHGMIQLEWKRCKNGILDTSVRAPAEIKVTVLPPSL